MKIELPDAISSAKAALVGESIPQIEQALADLLEALGQGQMPDCNCDRIGHLTTQTRWQGQHRKTCPCHAWEEAPE